MFDYLTIKNKILNNKQKIITGLCFILVFIIGFASGRGIEHKEEVSKTHNINYTKKEENKPKLAETEVISKDNVTANKKEKENPALNECPIKGNVSANGNKIYHVKGGAFYNKVKAEVCFKNSDEAVSAGFRKSTR